MASPYSVRGDRRVTASGNERKPRLLDLFCGAGGAAAGYSRAGFEVVGVDIAPQPSYPFPFMQGDALELALELAPGFDVIHASPPCQAYSVLRHANPEAGYASLIGRTRELLERTGLPWVIENVPGSPTRHVIVLCGSMFGLGTVCGGGKVERRWRQLRRHRNFETSFAILSPPCQHDGEAIGVYGGGPVARVSDARGGYQGTLAEKQAAMGVSWMNAREINQAIPPAYTDFIGQQIRGLLPAKSPLTARSESLLEPAPR